MEVLNITNIFGWRSFLHETKYEFVLIASQDVIGDIIVEAKLVERFHYFITETYGLYIHSVLPINWKWNIPGLNMYSYMVATVSPYRDKIDQFFAILIESGLLDTFISWVRFSKDQHHAVQYRPEENLNSFISFECFLPMVYGLLFFQFFSILVFVCELMWSRIVRKVYPNGQWLRV